MPETEGQNSNAQPGGMNPEAMLQAIMSQQLDPTMFAGGGVDTGPTPADLIQDALSQAVQAVLPTSGYSYDDEDTPLPHWFPQTLRDLADTGQINLARDLQGVYDPYFGVPDVQEDDRVYMGRTRRKVQDVENENYVDPGLESKLYGQSFKDNPESRKKTRKGRGDRTLTFQQAINLPYEWEEGEVEDAMKRFREAGQNVTSFDELLGAWQNLVSRASMTYSSSGGERKLTPWDVLELSKREAQIAGTFTNFESGSKTTTVSSVADISEGQSWQVLQSTLSSLLGRDPSDRELRDYAYRMNSLAAQNPSVTKTVTNYRGGEAVGQDVSTTGGFDAADMAQEAYEDAQDSPEYAKVQAGTTYYNALIQAIGAVGEV